MSSLTEEQRRIIEEKRLKAIEIKRKAELARNQSLHQQFKQPPESNSSSVEKKFQFQQKSKINQNSSSSSSNNNSSTNSSQFQNGAQNNPNNNNNSSNPISRNVNTFASTNQEQKQQGAINNFSIFNKDSKPNNSKTEVINKGIAQNSTNSTKASLVIPTVGTCALVSATRFQVNIGYHKDVITIFKSIPSGIYDPSSKKWSFSLEDHSKLMRELVSLRPNVTCGPLPYFISQIFGPNGPYVPKPVPEYVLESIDPVLVKCLFGFQKEGILKGIEKGGRILNADDMGLGKTIQALGIAHYYYREWPLLIVTPSSMKFTWREAIIKWLPSVPSDSVRVVESKNDWSSFGMRKVIILSYDLLTKLKDDMRDIKVVICDESHNLKNFKTARTKATVPIIKSAKRAILLSGTPALSRPMELYTQISAISPKLFPNPNEFGIRYCAGKKNSFGWDYTGSSNMEELQLVLRETIMIRRMKNDVLKELPSKIRQMLILDPSLVRSSSKGLKSRAAAFNDPLKGNEKHGKLLEYFSETGKAKIDAVRSYVKDLIEDGKKFLCFAHHSIVLDGVSEELDLLQCKYIRIDGSTGSEERKKLCDHFQKNPDIRVAVLSITAANSGITLTAAHLVVFAELFWNPGILTQAEDRAHRIGQQDSVLIQYLVAKGTADDYLWQIIVEKLDVLSKAGLSKDDFSETDNEKLKQTKNNGEEERGILKYFSPLVTQKSENSQNLELKSNGEECLGENFEGFFDDSFTCDSPPPPIKKIKEET